MASSLAQRNLINDIAAATALEQPLTDLVLQRPYIEQVIVAQCVYTARLITQMKACCLGLLAKGSSSSGRPKPTPDHGGGLSSVNKPLTTTGSGGAPLSTVNTRSSTFNQSSSASGAGATTLTTSFSSLNVQDPVCLVATPLQVHISVIGCGSMGTKIVDGLMKTKVFHPSSITCVSRRPDSNSRLAAMGMTCCRRAADAVGADTDLVIVAVPPSQFPSVAKEIKGKLRPFATILSVCVGIDADKVASEMDHPIAITTSLDVDALGRAVAVWKQEDEAAAEHTRETYVATKKFTAMGVAPNFPAASTASGEESSQIQDPDDIVHAATATAMTGSLAMALQAEAKSMQGPRSPAEKRQLRYRQLLHHAFPREGDQFFNRFFFNHVMSCVSRGVTITDALTIVWTHLVPKQKQGFISCQPPLNNNPLFSKTNKAPGGGVDHHTTHYSMMTAEQLAAGITGEGIGGEGTQPTTMAAKKGQGGPMATHGRLAALCTVTNLTAHLGCSSTRVVMEDFKGRFNELLVLPHSSK